MKKPAKRAAKSSRKPKIQMCVDRILTGAEKIKAMQAAGIRVAKSPADIGDTVAAVMGVKV